MDAASPRKHLKIYNFGTTDGMKMKLTMIMCLHKTFGLANGFELLGVTEHGQKTSQEKPNNWFFSLISWNFEDYIKNCIICDTLLCTASLVKILYQSDFIWGSYTQKKPPRSSPKSTFLVLRKHLKIHNMATTNTISMKLTRIMYLHETFHLAKHWAVTVRA